MGKKKGQMIFEFIIAAVLFFGIVFYVINYLNIEVGVHSGRYFTNELENKAVQVSEFLMHDPGIWLSGEEGPPVVDPSPVVIGLSDGYPMLNSTKINYLSKTCANDYSTILDKLDMGIEVYGGGGRWLKAVIIINDIMTGNTLVQCGYEPVNVTYAEVNRIGVTEDGKFVNVTVGVWG
jgi:hypothetical protein